MRLLLTTSLALAILATPSAAGAAVELDGAVPVDYRYDVRWNPQQRMVDGLGRVTVENRSSQPVERVWLRLRPNGGRTVLQSISTGPESRIAGYRANRALAALALAEPVPAGGRRSISFTLRLTVPRENSSLGRSAGLDLFGDALPVVAVGGPRGLRLGAEPSYGEGSFNPQAAWRVAVRVPRALRVTLPGAQKLTRRGRSSTDYRTTIAATRDVAFAVGRFSSLQASADGVRISVHAPRSLRRSSHAALERAVAAHRALKHWYGPLDQKRLRVVLGDLEFGGAEYPGLVFSTPDRATIAHEVAHQWFYGLVGNDQYSDPFLDESLTAFAEQELAHPYDCDPDSPLAGHSRGLATGMRYWGTHAAEYEQTIYRGGACALIALRHEIGEPALRSAIRLYVAENAGKLAGLSDFFAALRAAAPWHDFGRWQRQAGLAG